MANQDHVNLLLKDVVAWNKWREQHPSIRPDLSYANLSHANLTGPNVSGIAHYFDEDDRFAVLEGEINETDLSNANLDGVVLTDTSLCGVNLQGASLVEAELLGADFTYATLDNANLSRSDLRGAIFCEAHLNGTNLRNTNLRRANLSRAQLIEANLSRANLTDADLTGAYLRNACLNEADLRGAQLVGADLSQAQLRGTDLQYTNFVNANLSRAILIDCAIYGISCWDVATEDTIQSNLFVTCLPEGISCAPYNYPPDTMENDDKPFVYEAPSYYQPIITVDSLKVAQFIYLLLNNKEIRNVIDTITSKVVLILGNFSKKRKAVLDAIRDRLREQGRYIPVIFDFQPSENQDLEETVVLLARMSRFIIADITDPRCIPQELHAIIPNSRSVPVQPLLEESQKNKVYAMFKTFQVYPWVLPIYYYKDQDITSLFTSFNGIIEKAEDKVMELKNLRKQSDE